MFVQSKLNHVVQIWQATELLSRNTTIPLALCLYNLYETMMYKSGKLQSYYLGQHDLHSNHIQQTLKINVCFRIRFVSINNKCILKDAIL